jgi:hypothetical protein
MTRLLCLRISMFDDAGLSVKLSLCEAPDELSSRCLPSPAQLRMPVTANLSDVSSDSVVHCAYWNTSQDEWIVESLGQLMNDGTVLCNTTHFTDFNT